MARHRSITALPTSPILVHVRCHGQRHRLMLGPQGHLGLLDHDWRAEEVARALGATPSRCMEILDGWRGASPALRLPLPLIVASRVAFKRHTQRSYKSPFDQALLRKNVLEHNLETYAKSALAQCRYAQDLHPQPLHFQVFVTESPFRTAYLVPQAFNRIHRRVLLRFSWEAVYRLGLAVVDGWFVVQIIARLHPGVYRVQAIRGLIVDGRYELRLCPAIIEAGHLRWED